LFSHLPIAFGLLFLYYYCSGRRYFECTYYTEFLPLNTLICNLGLMWRRSEPEPRLSLFPPHQSLIRWAVRFR
jgi:hypothetical protein